MSLDPNTPPTQDYSPLAEDETEEQALRDTRLGEMIDRYLEAPSAMPPAGSDPELQPLSEMALQLQGLGQLLAASSAEVATMSAPNAFAAAPSTHRRPVHVDPAPPPSTMPTQIGKFRVVESLGRGGQAVTYKAFDPDTHRHVVLKLYHSARTSEQQECVLREARALARARSRFVAQCYGVERHNGAPYLIMEYVAGRSLADQIKLQRPSVSQSVALIAQAAEGLAAVHACGLLHRDLKPANILIGDDGAPRLIDFGLAMPLGDAAMEHISGTLPYMAPEQARAEIERIDPRTDLFGLGAVLYHLLTGAPPHPGRPAEDVRLLIERVKIGDVVSARELNPALSASVNALCMKCLAKDPTQRYASAAEMAQALRGQLRSRRKPALLLAAALLLALVGVGAYWWSHQPHDTTASIPIDTTPRDARTGRVLRRDFPVKIELIGTRLDADGQTFLITEGQFLSVRIEVFQPCYVGVWHEDDKGTYVQLFPNEYDSNHRIAPGQPRLIPGEERYSLRARFSKGPERLRVLATTQMWTPGQGKKKGPYDVFASQEEKEQAFRGIELTSKEDAVAEWILPVKVLAK